MGKMESGMSLSEARRAYLAGAISRGDLEGLIFRRALGMEDDGRRFAGGRERWAEFIGWLYPRLSLAVDAWQGAGDGFDAYIDRLARWSRREYLSRDAGRAGQGRRA